MDDYGKNQKLAVKSMELREKTELWDRQRIWGKNMEQWERWSVVGETENCGGKYEILREMENCGRKWNCRKL